MDVRRFCTAIRAPLCVAFLALVVSLVHAPVASAAAPPVTQALPRVDTVQVGPIAAAGGFDLYLTAEGCGSGDPGLELTYLEQTTAATLSHAYSGARAVCSIQRSPAGARLRVSVPGLVDVAVQIAHIGPALAHPGLPVGCGAPFGPELPATATGRIAVAIHPRVFGRVTVSSASAQIFSGGPQSCPARQALNGRELTAVVGRFIINALAPDHGPAQLQLLDPDGDSPSPGLQGTLGVTLSGAAALGVEGSTGVTRIGASTGLTAGSLSFTALALCPGYQGQNGALDGTLTIRDPLLGRLRVNGADASAAFSGQGKAQAGTCDGPGSEPVFPDLVSSCDQLDSDCSVSTAGGLATLFDETSPGTQTITSESVDFGDGSPPVAIANDGALLHSYAAPGTYIATLSVTDAVGTVFTASTPVVIDA
jgi:hypothetical protein